MLLVTNGATLQSSLSGETAAVSPVSSEEEDGAADVLVSPHKYRMYLRI